MASAEATENGSTKTAEPTTVAAENSQSDAPPQTETTAPESTEKAEEEQAAEVTDAEVMGEAEAKGNDGSGSNVNKWPGWPGDCVFRLVVPVLKVGSIIGRKGELIKKMCEETRARIRVLDGPISSPDRVVSTLCL